MNCSVESLATASLVVAVGLRPPPLLHVGSRPVANVGGMSRRDGALSLRLASFVLEP